MDTDKFRKWFLTKNGFIKFGYFVGGGGMAAVLLATFGPAGGFEWWVILIAVGAAFGWITSHMMRLVLREDIRAAAAFHGVQDPEDSKK